jgi:hypothetical protein
MVNRMPTIVVKDAFNAPNAEGMKHAVDRGIKLVDRLGRFNAGSGEVTLREREKRFTLTLPAVRDSGGEESGRKRGGLWFFDGPRGT